MAWYNPFTTKVVDQDELYEKLNPAQPYYDGKVESSREPIYNYERAYEELEIVNRAVNMVVDDAAEIPTTVGDATKAKEKLNWSPKISFEELVKEMVEEDLKLVNKLNN